MNLPPQTGQTSRRPPPARPGFVLLAVAGFVAVALAGASVLLATLGTVSGEARQARSEAALRLAWLGAEAALPVLARTEPPEAPPETPEDSAAPPPILRLPLNDTVTVTLTPASAPEALDPRTATEQTLTTTLEALDLTPPQAAAAARALIAARERAEPLTVAQWLATLGLPVEVTARVAPALAPRLVVGLAGQTGVTGWQVQVEAGGLAHSRVYLLSAPAPAPGLSARAARVIWHTPTEVGAPTPTLPPGAPKGFAAPG